MKVTHESFIQRPAWDKHGVPRPKFLSTTPDIREPDMVVVTYQPDPNKSKDCNRRMAEALVPSLIYEGPFTFNGK